MVDTSIKAYDLPDRVASYDIDMDLMHPKRSKMVDIALEIIPFAKDASISVLELGIGTGYFTRRFLDKYRSANVIAVDGAKSMVDLAKTRLGEYSSKVDIKVGDFRKLDELVLAKNRFDIVFSSYALHHLNRADKLKVIHYSLSMLRKGGWFINADLINTEFAEIDNRIQDLRVRGILERAGGNHKRFTGYETTKKILSDLQTNEGDQPLLLREDLQLLRDAGLETCDVFWTEYREAVTGGIMLSGR